MPTHLTEADYRTSVLFRRRSIRHYKQEMPKEWQIKALLEAGMNTQTACNQMPFEFVLVNQREILDKLQAGLPFARLKRAPAAIVVMSQRNWKVKIHPCGMFIQQDLAAVSHQICLMATEIGLGSVWCGLYPAKLLASAVRKVLNIPSDVMPLSIIPFGFPDEEKDANQKWLPERIHNNGY
jgi:nitroreductase